MHEHAALLCSFGNVPGCGKISRSYVSAHTQAGDTETMETQMGIAGIGPPQPTLTPPTLGGTAITPPAAAAGLPPPPTMGGVSPPPPIAGMTSSGGAPTQYLQVEGMVTAEVLTDDEEYAEVGLVFVLGPSIVGLQQEA